MEDEEVDVEVGLYMGGHGDIKSCPFAFLLPSLQAVYYLEKSLVQFKPTFSFHCESLAFGSNYPFN